MSLVDISFIVAFIVFPLVIVGLSVWALRTLNRRERRPLARFSSNNPAESTQEMPIMAPPEPRDWAASVKPTRGPVAQATQEVESAAAAPTQAFRPPSYRGRSRGVVRRISNQNRRVPRSPVADEAEQIDQ